MVRRRASRHLSGRRRTAAPFLTLLFLLAQFLGPVSAAQPDYIKICSGHGIRLVAVTSDPLDEDERGASPCALCLSVCSSSLVATVATGDHAPSSHCHAAPAMLPDQRSGTPAHPSRARDPPVLPV